MYHNDMTLIYIGLSALAAIFFFGLGYFIRKFHAKSKVKNAEDKAKKMLDVAQDEAGKIRHAAELEAKDLLLKLRTEFEKETKERRQELVILEKRLIQKEENLDRKLDTIDRGVIGDFRAGDGGIHKDILRCGFTPLYIGFEDVWNAVEHLRQVLQSGEWQKPEFNQQHAVT